MSRGGGSASSRSFSIAATTVLSSEAVRLGASVTALERASTPPRVYAPPPDDAPVFLNAASADALEEDAAAAVFAGLAALIVCGVRVGRCCIDPRCSGENPRAGNASGERAPADARGARCVPLPRRVGRDARVVRGGVARAHAAAVAIVIPSYRAARPSAAPSRRE